MNDRSLKQRLQAFMGAQYSLTDIARQLGINPQNLQTWFAAADVKSGTIEKLADVLGIPPTAFYDGTGIYIRRDLSKVDDANAKVIAFVLSESEK